ncbi:hypothetical protein RSOLAG1IB_02727 [Rhizoctonia solani AG-1 IB]|uniref:Uncharacterized protein n=2 Tax=Thanatephorus cucumeris (strain AG1-IB / isolate 7/3/14) TaxID=1108050 RepID=A0A0B7FP92_THACB|nr:hypothetical protein RSOLAG1IB_02727 [Rhizoctonia solani AG-1 IB]
MNPRATAFESSLPFFDASARRVRLPQPTSSSIQPNTALASKARGNRRTASHIRTPSWGSATSSSSESQPAAAGFPKRYHQCLTPEMSRSPSPTTQMTSRLTDTSMQPRVPRSPPLTPPAIHASLPSTPVGNYSLRLEPVTSNESAQAAVVFPDATNPKRALLLIGPAIARYVRERGKSARMHPYRVVFRPSA